MSDSLFTMNECWVRDIDGLSFGGGALAVIDASILDVSSSSFLSNHALCSGGAIYGLGNLRMSILDSFFEGNSLEFTNWTFMPHFGKAVAALAVSALETTNSVFSKHRWSVPLGPEPFYTYMWGARRGRGIVQVHRGPLYE